MPAKNQNPLPPGVDSNQMQNRMTVVLLLLFFRVGILYGTVRTGGEP